MNKRSTAVILAAVFVVVVTHGAVAQGLAGPEVGLTRLADRVLQSAAALGLVVPVVGVVLVGLRGVFGFQLSGIGDLIIAGAIVTLGAGAFTAVMGAELPTGATGALVP